MTFGHRPELKTTRASAHAKVILLGEHFVLPWIQGGALESPGCTALALPLLNLKTEVEIMPSRVLGCDFEVLPACGLQDAQIQKPSLIALMQQALAALTLKMGWDVNAHPCWVTSRSSFPISRGLGSSASFSVALTRAFCAYTQTAFTDGLPFIQEIENLFHGKSSGLDIAAVLSDLPIMFRGGRVLSSFTQRAGDFVVVDSSPRLNSARWIEKTVHFREANPKRWIAFSAVMDESSQECASLLSSTNFGNAKQVGQLLDQAQRILKELGLVTDAMESILELGKKCGALSGKMSGAGGGGALILFTHAGEGAALAAKLQARNILVLSHLPAYVSSHCTEEIQSFM